MILALLSVLVLICASALFVAAEFALIAARRSAVEPLALSSARARATLAAMDDVSVMLACAQLGITVCGLVLGAVGEPAVAHVLEPALTAMGVPESAVGTIGLVVGMIIVVALHVAFGEMVPKNVALAVPERTAVIFAPILRAIAGAIGPIVRGLDHLANLTVRAVGMVPSTELASTVTRGELAALVRASAREGLLDAEDEQLIDAALEFDVVEAASLALPATSLVTVGSAATPDDVERVCAESGFSRFPVRTADASGRFMGYIHVRDALAVPAGRRGEPLTSDVVRPLPQLPAGATVRAAVEVMQRERAHMCACTDAAGGPDTILLLEDAVESLVGEVIDATRRR